MKRILAGLLSCALALAQAAWMPALSAAATDQTAPAYTWSLKDGTAAVTNSDDGSQLIFRDVYHAEEQSGALTLYFIKEARYEPKANYLSIYVQESDLGGPVGKFALYTADPETGTLLQPTGEILSLVELKKQGLYYREEGYRPEVGWKVLPPEAGAIIPAASGFTEDNLCFSFSNESLTSNSWPQNTVSLQVCIVDSPDSMLLARKTGILPTENGQWEHYSNGKWRFMTSEGFYADRWKKIGGKWYYFEPYSPWYGVMQTGWLLSGGDWYYLTGSGAMKTGWQKSGGKWYYLGEDGRMLKSCTVDGYTLDENGVWIP